MTGNKGIMFALGTVGTTGESPFLPEGIESVSTAGQNFVGIALMSHIKNKGVGRGLKHPVQRDGQLNCTEIGG